MSDIEAAEARIEALEEQVVELTGLLAELAKSGGSSRKETTWRLSPFNPLVIAAPALRRDAWLRLYDFVELLNATFGTQRHGPAVAPLYITAGWWENPLAVTYLAALCEAWVEACVTTGDPLAGGHDMLWLLQDRAVPLLQQVCGPVSQPAWGQRSDSVSFSLEPPVGTGAPETYRRTHFEDFLSRDEPLPARTTFMVRVPQAQPPSPARRGWRLGLGVVGLAVAGALGQASARGL